MFNLFQVILKFVKGFLLNNKEHIKEILWELLIDVIKYARENRNDEKSDAQSVNRASNK